MSADGETVPVNGDTEIRRLAELSSLDYEREREAAAEKLHCRVGVLDKLVEAARPKPIEEEHAGQTVELPVELDRDSGEAEDAAAYVKRALDDDKEVKRLAGLSTLEFERELKPSAEKLGCRTSGLEKLVKAERAKNTPPAGVSNAQGRPIELPQIEPWAEEVDGVALLDQAAKIIRKYVILSDAQAKAVALWAVFTWAFDAFDVAPKLVLRSAQKRSGKSRLVAVLARITARPLVASGITAAALLRVIDQHRPTLLLDEMDAVMKGDREMSETLRGLFNAGFDRATAFLIKTAPLPEGGYEVVKFSAWAPQLLSGIGNLPDTVRDRSIEIGMKRKLPTEKVARLRRRDGTDLEEIARKMARWAGNNIGQLHNAIPDSPDYLNDRAADAWEPLLAIADQAGGDWPEKARKTAQALSGDGVVEDENISTKLLADLRDLFMQEPTGILFGAEIVAKLTDMADRPWGEIGHGKPLTQSRLADMLKGYGVRPAAIRRGDEQKRGYSRGSFDDAFCRYLPAQSVTVSQHQQNRGFSPIPEMSQAETCDSLKTGRSADETGAWDGVTCHKPNSPQGTKIPLMITGAMRRRLRDLGHSNEAIRVMTPDDAWRLLDGAEDDLQPDAEEDAAWTA